MHGNEQVLWLPVRTYKWISVHWQCVKHKISQTFSHCAPNQTKPYPLNEGAQYNREVEHQGSHRRRNPYCSKMKLLIRCEGLVKYSTV